MEPTTPSSPHLFQWTSNSFNAVDSFRKGRFTEGSCLDTTLKIASAVYKVLFFCTAMWAITGAFDIFVRLPISLCIPGNNEAELAELKQKTLETFGKVPQDLSELPTYLESCIQTLNNEVPTKDNLLCFMEFLSTSFAEINLKQQNAIQTDEDTQKALKPLLKTLMRKIKLITSFSLKENSSPLQNAYAELRNTHQPARVLTWPTTLEPGNFVLSKFCAPEVNTRRASQSVVPFIRGQTSEIEEHTNHVGLSRIEKLVYLNSSLGVVATKITQFLGTFPYNPDSRPPYESSRLEVNSGLDHYLRKFETLKTNIFQRASLSTREQELNTDIEDKVEILQTFAKSHRKTLIAERPTI